MTEISIITPAYCDLPEKIDWLGECINSVRQQTFVDWEMVIIDDRSPHSLDALKAEFADDKRIRWFRNAQNYGPAMTRNTAVELAVSECLLPLDSDDLLAGPEVLSRMHEAWSRDRTKIIYGDLWLSRKVDKAGTFQRFKRVELGQYTFELAMKLDGIMPVTGMHSKDCYQNTICELEGRAIYGWKPILSDGLEDVEYWIAAGKRGFCGQKIDFDTLVYRKQETARSYQLRFVKQQYEAMQRQIMALHPDIYSGRFPKMACGCGGGGAGASQTISDPVAISQQNNSGEVRYITTMEQMGFSFPEKDLEWVAYQGPKEGRFGTIHTRSPSNLPNMYTILGKGHFIQIHKSHKWLFEQRARLQFYVNQQDPRKQPEPEQVQLPVELPQPRVVKVEDAKPVLATIERFDDLAQQTRQAVRAQVEPPPLTVRDLGLPDYLIDTIIKSGLTVEQVANSTPGQLSELPGIGLKRGQAIIDKAKQLLKIG